MKKKIITALLGTCLTLSLFTGCGGGSSSENTAENQPTTQTQTTQDTTTPAAQNTQQTTAPTQNTQASVTEEDANKTALEKSQVAEADTIGLTVKMDYDDGMQLYEVNIYTPEKDYEYEINASDGTIIKEDMEATDQVANINSQTSITPDEAVNIVLGKVSGATEKNVRMKLEMDDGRSLYEGEVIYNNTSYEFEMDAETGTIYEWSQETL